MPVADAGALRRGMDQAKTPDVTEDDLCHILDGALDPLADELNQCLRYHDATFRNSNIERVIFTGGGAYDVRLCKTLATRLNLRAQIGDPLAHIDPVKEAGSSAGLDERGPKPDWAVAVGLSLRAMNAEETRRRHPPVGARS